MWSSRASKLSDTQRMHEIIILTLRCLQSGLPLLLPGMTMVCSSGPSKLQGWHVFLTICPVGNQSIWIYGWEAFKEQGETSLEAREALGESGSIWAKWKLRSRWISRLNWSSPNWSSAEIKLEIEMKLRIEMKHGSSRCPHVLMHSWVGDHFGSIWPGKRSPQRRRHFDRVATLGAGIWWRKHGKCWC